LNVLLACSPHTKLTEPFKGGTEAFSATLATELSKSKGYNVSVISDENEFHESFEPLELDSTFYDLSDRVRTNEQALSIYKALSFAMRPLNDFDLIHYNSFMPELYQSGTFQQLPVVVTLHIPPNPTQVKIHKSFCKLMKRVRYVAVSKRLKEAWAKHLTTSIDVIPNGVDVNKWSFNKSSNRSYYVWTGRISKEKNPRKAIEISRQLGLDLLLAGPIYDKEYFNVNVLPFLNNKIQYIGHIDQKALNALYEKAIAQLCTSNWQEPFGLNVIEALMCGVPVIGNINSIQPEFRELYGILPCEFQSAKELEDKLSETAIINRAECRKSAKAFGLKSMLESYVSIYDEVLSEA
tara:strand:+ start:182410 stop:183462 length:1053 start_codon:yes stop_codon:yes gene_type:complete